MLCMRHAVIALFIIVAFDKINCASVITEKEIANTLNELEIRDDNNTGNSSLEVRSRAKRWIEERKRTSTSSEEFTSSSNENQSPLPLSIDAHHQGRGEKRKYLKKEPINDELYSYNTSSSSFAENENTFEDINRDNEDDFEVEDFEEVDFDQVDFDGMAMDENDGGGEGEIYDEMELDIQPHIRHKSHGSGHKGKKHGHHSGGKQNTPHHHPSGHHKLHLVKVTMPNGKRASISVPEQLKNWKCGRPTLLLNLDPHGKNGRREFKLVAKVVEATKREHTSGHFKHYRFIKIQKVVNGCFWKRYRTRQTEIAAEAKNFNERMLFHGTNKVKDLLKTGFDERYSNINGMFGAGIYFAKHSSKSNQYAFGLNQPCPKHQDKNCDKCARQMILCRVTMGKVKYETGPNKIAHAPPGYHSVMGVATHKPGGLQYPEYIVYRGEQVYPEYLITYRIVK